jgi:hypothetical protein
MVAHKVYGGSNSDRWSQCPGSPYLSTQVPPRPAGQAAIEGTAQHAVMEQLLNDGKLEPLHFLGSTILGVTLTQEHINAIDIALEAYMEIVDEFPEDAKLFAERGVDLTDEAGGTMDAGIVHGRRGAVIDFKFGQIEVEADGTQGLFYGVCARKTEPAFASIQQLDVYIIQPAYDPATVKISYPGEFLDTAERNFLNAIAVSKAPNPSFVEGEWCTWCPAKLVCPSKLQGLQTLTTANHILDLDELGGQVAKLQDWIKWAEEARERIQLELEHGRPNKYFKLVQKRAIRGWKSEANAIAQFRKAKIDDDVFMPRKMISPAAAEKGMLPKKVVADLAVAVSSGNTIAPHADKRPPVLPTAALAAAVNRVK